MNDTSEQTSRPGDSGSHTDATGNRHRILFIAGLTSVLVVLGLLVWYSIDVFLLMFAGVLLAIFLRTLTDWCCSWSHLSHVMSLGLVTLLLLAVAGLTGWFLAEQVAGEFAKLVQAVPKSIEDFRQWLKQTSAFKQMDTELPTLQEIVPQAKKVAMNMAGYLSTSLGFLAAVLIVLFVGFFLAATPELYRKGLIRLLPIRHRDRASEVLGEVGHTLKWWLVGKIVTMLLVGILISSGLWLIGVPLPLALGVIAMILTFIPNFGPIASAALGVLLAFTVGATTALYALILYLTVQTVESYVITPLIQREAVELPPAITIFAQVLLAALAGVLGLVIATPLAAATLVVVKMLYVGDALGDHETSA